MWFLTFAIYIFYIVTLKIFVTIRLVNAFSIYITLQQFHQYRFSVSCPHMWNSLHIFVLL